MNKKLFLEFILLTIALLPPLTGVSQIKEVWALGDGEKVYRNDLQHTDKNGNYTWHGDTIRIEGLYNEVLAFQVIVETGVDSVKGIDLAVADPVNKESGKVIGGNTLQYGPSGTIEVFSEHYLLVTDSTRPNWYYGSPAAAPKKMTGWIPDALIPANATAGAGGLPVDVGPSRNQGFWIDVYLPRDQEEYPSGIYRGTVQVYQAGKRVAMIPLKVTLLPPYMPDENRTNVWVYSSDPVTLQSYFPGLPKEQIVKMIKFVGHRHRVDMAGGFRVNETSFNAKTMDSYKPYLDGTAYTPSNGYSGNGEGVGEKIFPIGMYGGNVMGDTKEIVQQQSNLWVEWFKKNAPRVTYFWYITDEPSKSKYAWIKERAEWIKSNPGEGGTLPVFTTTSYKKALSGAIDIFAGYDGVDLNVLPAIRKSGGDHWFYNGNRPRYGSVILEAAAVDLRIDSWIMYKYGIHTWFLWQSTAWDHNGQGPKAHLHQRIYTEPLTFINDNMEFGNGDGILYYPGHTPFYPEQDRGLNRILPSIRLNNIRRGQQDADIMWMAEQKAGRKVVISLINKVIPKALSEVSMRDSVPWSQSGDDYDKVRGELLQLLQQ
jgi:hypothetical protein